MSAAELSPMGALVRRADPDRFLASLFAPPAAREALWTLYAFNNELARAREVVREPMMARIRLQWWREVVEGAPRAHEVAVPLAALLATGRLDPAALLALVAAREAEVDTIPTHEDWREVMLAGPGGLAAAAAALLGVPDAEGVRALGAAYGAAGAVGNVAALARAGRCLLPEDLLAAEGLTPEAAIAAPAAPGVARVCARLAADAQAWLAARPPRRALPAVLHAALARRDLRHPGARTGPRGLGDRLAVLAAYLRGKV